MILASPPTGLLLHNCTMKVSPPTVPARYQYSGCLFAVEACVSSKTGDCGSPPTPKKPKADSERLATAKEYEERRRPGFKAAWRDEFAWLTYEPAPADSDANGNGSYRFHVFRRYEIEATGIYNVLTTLSHKLQCHCVDETPRPWPV